MQKLPQISEAEFEVMRIVWDEEPVSTNVITDKLAQSTDWSPKTIQTLIRRLVTKGALTYEKQCRMFVYTATVQKDEYLKAKSLAFVKHYFNGDITAFIAYYFENDDVNEADMASLQGMTAEPEKS